MDTGFSEIAPVPMDETMSIAVKPTGPRGGLLMGCLREFGNDRLNFLTRCAREHGDFVPFRLGHRRVVLIAHPNLIEEVLVTRSKEFIKHYGLRFFRPLIGEGLLTSEGSLWLRQRRLIQPAFLAKRLPSYFAGMLQLTETMMKEWADGGTMDVHAEMSKLTMAISTRMFFDSEVSTAAEEVMAILRRALYDSNVRFGSLIPLPNWVPTPANLRMRRMIRRLDELIGGLIRDRRNRPERESDDVLSILLRARDEADGTGMTDKQLRDEVMTLFLAGHGTTANALAWTWYLLSKHPEVESNLHAELDREVGDRPLRFEDLPKLTYLQHVMHESMRLYPPAYVMGREAGETTRIGGHSVPRGTTILISQWVTHRDGRFFDEPESFRPERWADGLMKRLPKFAYFPFGGGPRVCIGNGFAEMELPLILATVARRYRFEVVPDHPVVPWPAVTLRPEFGIRAVVRARS